MRSNYENVYWFLRALCCGGCNGSGRLESGDSCPGCNGTGFQDGVEYILEEVES